jgi:hypothetical protein
MNFYKTDVVVLKNAIITAALIIAVAMLGCATIEYQAFTAGSDTPSIEQEAVAPGVPI